MALRIAERDLRDSIASGWSFLGFPNCIQKAERHGTENWDLWR